MFSQFSSEPNVDLVEIKNLEEYKGRRKTISKEDSSSEEVRKIFSKEFFFSKSYKLLKRKPFKVKMNLMSLILKYLIKGLFFT